MRTESDIQVTSVPIYVGSQLVHLTVPSDPISLHATELVLTGTDYPFPPRHESYRPGVIIDIGANIGAAALYFLAHFPDAVVHAFEPSAAARAMLGANVATFGNVEVHPFGLYDRCAVVPLYGGATSTVTSSIFPCKQTTETTENIALRPAAATLSALDCPEDGILKIDTEGCEVAILRDLGARLEMFRLVYLEYHSEEDRLAIDQLMTPTHVLFHSRANFVHRGVCGYVARSQLARDPVLDAARIRPS